MSWKTRSFEDLSVTKTARSDDISKVNLIVGRNVFAKLTKLETSCIEMFHSEKMSSRNRFQTKGLE